jgi:hypothetical protein
MMMSKFDSASIRSSRMACTYFQMITSLRVRERCVKCGAALTIHVLEDRWRGLDGEVCRVAV